ncbi:unnamed protein product [Peniophora sp. CBMAI 1063]|nr:unnamed protein product [Peniophora sp. CBMAI 1063]
MPVLRDSRSRSRTHYGPAEPYIPHPLLVAHAGRTVAVPRTAVYMQTLWNIKTSFRALQGVDVSRLVIKSKAIPGCEGVNAEVSAALWPGVASRIGALEIVVDEEGGDEVKVEDVQNEPSEASEATPAPDADNERPIPRAPSPAPHQDQIFVKTLTGRTLTFYVDLSISAKALKALVAVRDVGTNRSAERWCLAHAYSGVKLLPERTLAGNKVRKESTLQMVPQCGGSAWWPLDPTGMVALLNRAGVTRV